MSSYAELTYLLGAMIVFGFLTLNTSRSFNSSRQTLYQAESEYRAIAAAQDEIDKVQWIYDPNDLDPSSGSYVYTNYPIIESVTFGPNDEYSTSYIINGTSELIEDTGSMKRFQVVISVLDQNVTPNVFVTLEFIKSYSY